VIRQIGRAGVVALAGLSFLAALASCGKQGDLERPGPLFSPNTKAEVAAQQRARADSASNAAAANRVSPPQNPAIVPYTTTEPISQAPIPGQRPRPSGSPSTSP